MKLLKKINEYRERIELISFSDFSGDQLTTKDVQRYCGDFASQIFEDAVCSRLRREVFGDDYEFSEEDWEIIGEIEESKLEQLLKECDS